MTKQEYLDFVRLWIDYYEPRNLRELRYRIRTCPKKITNRRRENAFLKVQTAQ